MIEDTNAPQNTTAGVDFAALPVGQAIGRYTIVSVIGHGGFGITYRARDTQLGREVAIKEFLPVALAVRQDGTTVLPRSATEAEDFDWARTRFVDEGRTLASLHDAPAIVRVFDFLEANGTAYLVMQLLSGETLEQRLKRTGPLSSAHLQGILWPLLDGLEHVHDAGFLHRDIKPANILLNAVGKPTLIDFGASRAAIAGRSAAMTAIFTPGYAAAEQMTSARQGPWTDIYGLSATLYHAITGRAPPNVFDRLMEDGYEPLGRLQPPGFPRGLLVGLDAGLAVKASDRPLSIAGWRPILGRTAADDDAVTVAMSGRATTTRTTTGASPAASADTPAGQKGVWIGVAAVALLVAVGGGYLALSPPNSPPGASPQVASAPPVIDAAAVAKRQAAEEEAQRALQDAQAAQQKADADARRKVEEEERRAAEAGEAALRLGLPDRQKIQVALTSQGFDTRGADGTFGTRSREMIAAWQRGRGNPATGYLTAVQQQALLREASAAVSKFDDDEQKKADEAKRKADDEAKVLAPPSVVTPAVPTATVASFDGIYGGWLSASMPTMGQNTWRPLQVSLRIVDGQATGEVINPECGVAPFSLPVAPSGVISGSMRMYEYNCAPVSASLTGRVSGNTLVLEIRGMIRTSKGSLNKRSEKAEEDERKAAEAGEAALRLGLADRQKIQVALTSRGFDTRGADGTLGARSREMIAAWQRSRGHPATGYLLAAQQQALLREASAAVSKFDDDERKKADEAKRKADDEAKARSAATVAPATPAEPAPAAPAPQVSAAPASAFDGLYGGALSSSTPTGGQGAMRPLAASLRVAGGQVTGETVNVECGAVPISLPVSPSGAISGPVRMYEFNCTLGHASFTGRVNGSTLVVEIRGTIRSAKGSLSKRGD